MNEQLKALIGETPEMSGTADGDANATDLYERITRLEQKLDKVLSLLDKDISIDDQNDEKIGITEAEGKIDEKEEYRESGEEEKGE